MFTKYTDFIAVNLNDPTPEVDNIVLNHKNVKKIIRTTNNGQRWNQGLQRTLAIEMLDDIKPNLVIFTDDDEELPPNFNDELKIFMANDEYKTWWWRLLYMYGDENHFRNDGKYKSVHACRAFKWKPGITYLPKYAGYACPNNFYSLSKDTRFNSSLPIKHWGYMYELDRQRKYLRANSDYCNEEYRNKVDKNMIIRELPEELNDY